MSGDAGSRISEDWLDYLVEHQTCYRYSAPVVHARHLLHLAPRGHDWQTVGSHAIELTPVTGQVRDDQDRFGNLIQRVELERPHQQLKIVARSRLQVRTRPMYPAAESMPWQRLRDELSYCGRPRTPHELEAIAYRTESPQVRIKNAFAAFADECFPHGQPILAGAEALMHKLHQTLTYAPGETTVSTSLLAVLETRRGVCQDYSHLMLACLRSLGLSARYVSGYLRTVPPADGAALVGADASHAWVSVYAPPFDWVDLDPTNGMWVGVDHLTLGWGRDFSDVSPVRGVIVGGGQHEVAVAVTVQAQQPTDVTEAPQ